MSTRLQRAGLGVLSLVLAAAIWLPLLHFLFAPPFPRDPAHSSERRIQALAARHLQLWTDPATKHGELDRMRQSNAEWDFMGRTFLVLSLAEMGVRDSRPQPEFLRVMDQIIDETLRLERKQGPYFFLMPYARARPFIQQPARSQFLDGEIAMMLAARRLVSERAEYKPL